MRRLAVALALLALAGCTSNPDPAVAEVADEPQSGQVVLEGQFMKTHVEDQEVSSEGGLHTLEVEGWRNVLLQFDIGINADLFLVPPGCDGPAAPCALQFTSDDTAAGTRVLVPAMAAGTWDVVLDREGGEVLAGSVYEITFDYIVA